MDEFERGLGDGATELTPDEEYELWCHYQDQLQEELLASWGVESFEELDFLGHDW